MVEAPSESTSAAEHLPLRELTPQSGGIGTWLLQVAEEPRVREYEYTWSGKSCKGKRFEMILLSPESGSYCMGQYKRRGPVKTSDKEFDHNVERFKVATTWCASKVSLAKEKPCYISSPLKIMIDLNSTKMDPVLQSIHKMPSEPTPLDTLHTILMCPQHQRVDVTALVENVSEVREVTSAHGRRYVADVQIRDDSGASEQGVCQCSFRIWLPRVPKSAEELAQLKKLSEERKPVTFFALQCDIQEAANVVKPDFERFRFAPCRTGPRAEQLESKANGLLGATEHPVEVVSALPVFVPRETTDYLSIPAKQTTCELLSAAVRSGAELLESDKSGASEHVEGILFQINHVRVIEPVANDELLTNDKERLFVPVAMVDRSGTVEVRMREKAALELSSLSSKHEFIEESEQGGLNFPILCSVRVHLKKQTSATEHESISAVVVEAAAQDVSIQNMPNTSSLELHSLLKELYVNVERLVVAPIGCVAHSPHGGMVVNAYGKQHQCSCVLTLIAHTGKSIVQKIGTGHRIVSKEVWNIPFDLLLQKQEGAPEHASNTIDGQVASFCTMNNVQYYNLSSTRGKEPVYAMVVISNASNHEGKLLYMVDKVAKINDQALVSDYITHFKKLSKWLKKEGDGEKASLGRSRTFSVSSCHTPYTVKNSRRLSEQPSGASLRSEATEWD